MCEDIRGGSDKVVDLLHQTDYSSWKLVLLYILLSPRILVTQLPLYLSLPVFFCYHIYSHLLAKGRKGREGKDIKLYHIQGSRKHSHRQQGS